MKKGLLFFAALPNALIWPNILRRSDTLIQAHTLTKGNTRGKGVYNTNRWAPNFINFSDCNSLWHPVPLYKCVLPLTTKWPGPLLMAIKPPLLIPTRPLSGTEIQSYHFAHSPSWRDVLSLSTWELEAILEIMPLEMAKIAHFSTATKLKLLQIYQSYFNWAQNHEKFINSCRAGGWVG